MSVIRVGSNGTYAEGWDQIFGGGSPKKKSGKKPGKATARKAGSKAVKSAKKAVKTMAKSAAKAGKVSKPATRKKAKRR